MDTSTTGVMDVDFLSHLSLNTQNAREDESYLCAGGASSSEWKSADFWPMFFDEEFSSLLQDF